MKARQAISLTFNLGGSHNPFHGFPFFFEFDEIKEAIDFFREDNVLESLFEIAHRAGSTPKNMVVWARFDNAGFYWEFKIALKNVREFKKYLDLTWEEQVALAESIRRDQMIEDIFE
jgi:hypothetical protein